MQITVDGRQCSGHGLCAATAPSVFRLNENGYNDTRDEIVPADLEGDATRGAEACPERAISVITRSGR